MKRIKHQYGYQAAKLGKKNLDFIFKKLNANLQGLTQKEAEKRQYIYGKNEVAHEVAPPAWLQFIMAFNNPFIYVLIILVIVSCFTDFLIPIWQRHPEETDLSAVMIMLIMVLLSVSLRFWQEFRSNNAALKLRSMISNTATVYRKSLKSKDALKIEVPMHDIVPGDIIFLSAGDMVPADIKLIQSKDLFISQAILTGESLPIEKYDTMGSIVTKSIDSESKIGERDSMSLDSQDLCFMGTSVVSGTAKAIVLAIGADTYLGSLAKIVVGKRPQTAFDKGVNKVSTLLIRFMVVMVPIVFLINGLTKGEWGEAFLFAIAVAVGLTPEMLPMIVSANLSKGSLKMAKKKVITKRLNAIQNLGAMDVLCTDKTGTLTFDKIILEHHVNINNQQDNSVLQLAWLNSYYQSGVRNLLDKAVVQFANNNPEIITSHSNEDRKIDELPFDFIRRRLSVIVHDDQEVGGHLLICKGAVEEILEVSDFYINNGQVSAIDDQVRKKLFQISDQYNMDGFRVLIVATKSFSAKDIKEQYSTDDEQALTIHGFLTFLDPPKDSAEIAIKAMYEKGITVKVLTGDNHLVTTKICNDIGINPGKPILGSDIERMSEIEINEAVERHTIFAKITPLQKSLIINALKKQGHTVGFLGDGINDAAALRDADVGISVDSGTDIAKESADIILLENNLQVLDEGIVQGRITFGNIIKYLNMTASSNFGNVFSVLVASAFIPFLPMLAIHLLIQNLLYDISQLSLPWDTMDKDFIKKPRKWDEKNIGRFMIWLGPTSSIYDISTYALMWFVFGATATVYGEQLFHSGWFVEGLLSQTLVVHMLRTRKIPFIQSTATLPVLLMTGAIMVIGIYIPFSSLAPVIGFVPLPLAYFPWLILTLVCYCLTAQLVKTIYIKRFKQWF